MPKILTPLDLMTQVPEFRTYNEYYNLPEWFFTFSTDVNLREQPVPEAYQTEFWKLREQVRILGNGENRLVNFMPNYSVLANTMETEYFARLAEDGKQIAFTPSDEFGRQDRQITMKLGRFLTRYMAKQHEQLQDNERVKEIVAQWNYMTSPPELHVTNDRHEIANIYENGPSSCMGQKTFTQLGCHPCEAYAGPDTVLGYIMDQNDHITARAVIRTDREPHQYVRIYGDIARMAQALKEVGITHAADGLAGARLLKLPFEQRDGYKATTLVVPYLDGGRNHAYDDPDDPDTYIRVCDEYKRGWTWALKQTAATTTHKNAKRCRHCRNPYLPEDIYPVDDHASHICLHCLIEHDQRLVLGLHEVLGEGGHVSLVSSDNRFRSSIVEFNNQLYHRDFLHEYDLYIVDGVVVDEHDERVVRCAATDQLRLRDNCLEIDGMYYSQMSDAMYAKYPQFTLGRLLDHPEDSDDPMLGEVYNSLIREYGNPLTRSEIRANTHPNIHPGLVRMLIQSSEQGFAFSSSTEIRHRRRA